MTAIMPITNVPQVEEAPAQSSAENNAENHPENEVEIQSQNDENGAESDDDSLGDSSVHADPEAEASEADPASLPVTLAPVCGRRTPSFNTTSPSGTSALIRPKRIYFPEHFCYCFSSNLCVLNTTNTD
jgi:hypothetical protein